MPLAALRWFTHQVRFSQNDDRECSKTLHATGFSQWLMTNLVASPLVGGGRLIAVGDKPRRYLRHSGFSPTKVGAQRNRHQIRTKVRSIV